MKKLILFSMLLGSQILGVTTCLYAQKFKVLSGDYAFLKGQKSINVVFDFSAAKFYNENLNEEGYISKRKAEIEEKNPGEFKNWLEDWKHSKEVAFPEKFLSSANKITEKLDFKFEKDGNSTYTVIVKTVWIYPAWFAGNPGKNYLSSAAIKRQAISALWV